MSGENLALLALGLCLVAVAFFVFRASSRLTFVVWAVVLFFVPVWVGASAGLFWSAIAAITLLALVASIADITLSPVDAVMASFVLIAGTLFALRAATLSAAVIALLEWVLPYVWGRIVLARVSTVFVTRVFATAVTVAAVLGIIEFITGANIFTLLPAMSDSAFHEWGTLQVRGGILRVEGAFGHSIAFGAALAMSSVFVVVVDWPLIVRLLALATVVGATVLTFSRIGLITLALTLVLALLRLPDIPRLLRGWIIGGGAVAAAIVLPLVLGVFADAGQEASGSADYRGGLFSLISQLRLVGGADDWTGLTVGGDYLGAYANSVDNAFLIFALRFGWIPAVLLVLALVAVAATVLPRGGATPPAVAVAAQLPALFAVALITQFGTYLWFLAGLAITWHQQRRTATAEFDVPATRVVSASAG